MLLPRWRLITVNVQDNVRDLDSVFYERNVRLLELCFDGQFHYGTTPCWCGVGR